MALKLVVLAALMAVAQAGLLASPAVLAPGAPLAAHTFAGPLGFATPIALQARPGGGGSGRQDQGQNQGQQGQDQNGGNQGGQQQQGDTQNSPGGSVNTGTIKISPPSATAIDTDFDPNPQYSYAFNVEDIITGDSKSQQETRNGDVVQGSYSLLEADGTRRTVEYSADPVNGFNAIVHREPAAGKAVIAGQAAAKVAASGGPTFAIAHPIAKLASPLTYSPGPYQPYHTKAIIG